MASPVTPKADVVPKHIQATWTDLSNLTRCQLTTRELYNSYFSKNGFSQPYFIFSLPYMNAPPYERVTEEVRFNMDKDAPLPLPWMEGTSIAFGKFEYKGQPWGCCPRNFLSAQEQKLKSAGINMRIGFELEFYLLNMDGSPVDATGYGEPMAFTGKSWKVISSAVDFMQKLGIPVWKYHGEAGPGQFEISIGPFEGSMLKAADSLVLARQAIFQAAAAVGLNATFAPRPIQGPGSSVHTTVSLWSPNDVNLFEVDPKRAKSFLAGIFNHLPSSIVIMCANGNSYDRLDPLGFSGGFHCIGTENRKAAIRCFNDEGVLTRFEVRNPDGTSNPHLVLGTLIGTGMDGIENGTPLCPFVETDPLLLPEQSRPPRLPMTLAQAISKFAESSFNRELYGDELFNLLLLVRRGEEAYWSSDKISMKEKMNIVLEKY